jgi:hypothetical protein
MKTTTQIFAAVVAGAALNVGLATANLHPVGNLPQVDLTETAATAMFDTAVERLPFGTPYMAVPFAVGVGYTGAYLGIF